jgi:RNA polymerase sigma factor (sigma-70 family)
MCDGEDRPETPIPVRQLAGDAMSVYGSDLSEYVGRRIDNSHDAEDVVQSTLLKLVSISSESLIVRKPFGFIRMIANRALAEFFKKQTEECERIVPFEDIDGAVESIFAENREWCPADDVERHQHYLGLLDQLNDELAEMPAMQRAALILAVREGLTHAEVAERLGLTELTVKTYVKRARAVLSVRLFSGDDHDYG